MASSNLTCPGCGCPLTASVGQTQIACPRCFAFLEIESHCSGVCCGCKATGAQPEAGCGAAFSEAPPDTSAAGAPEPGSTKKITGLECLKALFKRVFNV